jgi:hypothetical protein
VARITKLVKDRGCWLRVGPPEAGHVLVHPYEVPACARLARRGGAVPVLIAEQSPLSGHHAGLGTLMIRSGDDCTIAAKRSVRTKTTFVLRRKQLIGSALGRWWTALADRLTRAGQQAAHAVARRRSRRPIERSNLCPAGRDAEAPPGSLRS